MQELIKITTGKDGQKTVSARDLYAFLEIKKHFTEWMDDQLQRGFFIEDVDYQALHLKVKAGPGTQTKTDYALTMDTAKEISMLSMTKQGKVARRYFIECEKELRQIKGKKEQKFITDWDVKRFMVKTNYKLQTDAIKENIIPYLNIPKSKEGYIYSNEAELINFIVFGVTAKDWKKKNPDLVKGGKNMRDYADYYQLNVLANMESFNSILINKGMPRDQRLQQLTEAAHKELSVLYRGLNENN
jgi:phage anti-repressor protein